MTIKASSIISDAFIVLNYVICVWFSGWNRNFASVKLKFMLMKPDKLEKFAEMAIWTIEGIMVYMICAIFYKVVIAA